jgi:peptidoglycan/LPS O-acetylase OafA/YrhL
LDASIQGGSSEKLEARHDFHRKHRRRFGVLAVAAGVAVLVLVITGMPVTVYSYAVVAAIMVAGFFTLSVFPTTGPHDLPHGKNIVAGISFAYGTAMLAHAYTGFDKQELLKSPELICFAVLCILNISAIDLWEHAHRSSDPEIKASDELSLTLPLTLLGAASLVFALRDPDVITRPFFYAILTGAALHQILNRVRSRFSMDALRVLADVALLVPFIVFLVAFKS